jgi:HSP20 family protein
MYYDPFDELDRMHEELDRFFRRSFMAHDTPLIGQRGTKEVAPASRSPVYHVQETENNIVAAFELPGVQKSDIVLNVDDRFVELKVEQEKKHEDKKSYSMMSKSFYRRVSLPKEVDSQKATAEYKDGILRVEMPKKNPSEKGRRIEIK